MPHDPMVIQRDKVRSNKANVPNIALCLVLLRTCRGTRFFFFRCPQS